MSEKKKKLGLLVRTLTGLGAIAAGGASTIPALVLLAETGKDILKGEATKQISDLINKMLGLEELDNLTFVFAKSVRETLEYIESQWHDAGGKELLIHLKTSFADDKISIEPEERYEEELLNNFLTKTTDEALAEVEIALDETVQLWEINEGAQFAAFFKREFTTQLKKRFKHNVTHTQSAAFELVLNKLDGVHTKIDGLQQILLTKRIGAEEVKIEGLKKLTNIPPIDLDNVVGRENELIDLREMLMSSSTVSLVNGMGGIGKTTLATVYVYTFQQEYKHIAWISLLNKDEDRHEAAQLGEEEKRKRSMDALKSGFGDRFFLEKLGLQINQIREEEFLKTILDAVRRIQDGPSLLVIDNADKYLAAIHKLLPTPPEWQVLVTSRHQIPRFKELKLDFLSPENAVKLFKKYCTRITDNDLIDILLEQVEYHTLTIEILAKAAQRNHSTIEELQDALKNDLQAKVYTDHSEDQIDRVFSYLNSIFRLDGLNENEQWLAKHFCLLPHDFHHFDKLLELFGLEKQEAKSLLSSVLEDLYERGWLLKEGDDQYRMHRLISEVVKNRLEPKFEEVEDMVGRLGDLLVGERERYDFTNPFSWVPYGEAFGEYFGLLASRKLSFLYNELGLIIGNIALQLDKAVEYYKKALKIDLEVHGEKHSNIANSYNNIGEAWRKKGNYHKTIEYCEKALKLNLELHGEKNHNVAINYSILGLAYYHKGDNRNAMIKLKKALEIDLSIVGDKHPNIATRYNNISLVLSAEGKHREAITYLEKSLTLEQKNDNHSPFLANIYTNLGANWCDVKEYDKAIEYHEKALQINLEVFGEKSTHTALSYHDLGVDLTAKHKFGEALEYHNKALYISLEISGEMHPNVATSYYYMGFVWYGKGRYNKAVKHFEKSLAIYRNLFEEDHTNVQTVLKYLIHAKEKAEKSGE